MARKIKHTVAVVTGASSGIGRATALALAGKGATVVLTARRGKALEALAGTCEDLGGHALAVPADVRDADAVERVAAETVGRFGRLDAWVNNAAVNLFARFEEAPLDDYRRVVETNVLGYVHGARVALPRFREQGSGVLVNVGSVLSYVGSPYQSAYVLTKYAVRGLADSLRQELADAPGIDVCTVLPGPIDTPLFTHAGNYTGRVVKALDPTIDADRVARGIVRCIRRPRRELPVGASVRGTLAQHALAPGLTERVTAATVERGHFTDERAEPTSGNLFEPMEGTDSVSGGWKPSTRRKGALVLAGAAGAAIAVGRIVGQR